jgi:acetolactate synthase-1/2/3 large subunit
MNFLILLLFKQLIFLKQLSCIKLTGSQYIIKKFNQYNINTIFGYTGGSNLKLFDSLYDSNINLIINRHEQFCGFSAQGFSKSSNNLGVVITTSGPGLTNIITPLQDAFSDGIPLLAISGQVSKNVLGTDAFQECNATALTKPCTKYNKLIKDVDDLKYIDIAIEIALQNRKGPVHLDICSNVFSTEFEINENEFINNNNNIEKSIIKNDYKMIIEINKLLLKSKKPIIILGQGCKKDYKLARKFCKKYNLPVTTTLHGLGIIDESTKLSLKMLGMHGSYASNLAIQNADLIIGIGYRFDDRTIGNIKKYGLKAKKGYGIIHVDNSQEKIDKVKKIIKPRYSLKISSDIFFKKMNSFHIKYNNIKNHKWLNIINKWKNDYPFIIQKKELSIPFIIQELSKKLSNDYLITTGVGVHQMQVAQYFNWKFPNTIITSGSQGTMGVGLPFAIGCKLANPNKNVICIDGDGSFMMSCNDLVTLKQYNIPINILIMDNENLQMVSNWQDDFYNSRYSGSKLLNPNFVDLAKSCYIDSILCDDINYLDNILDIISKNTVKPMLFHFKVKSTKCLPFVAPNKALDDMILE